MLHALHTFTPTHDLKRDIIDFHWVREEGRLIKRPIINMSESVNEGSRMDQIEANLTKMTEQLQALTTAMSNMVVPRAARRSENETREGPLSGLNDDAPVFDDDMVEYAAGRIAKSQDEIQKLRDQMESVTRKLKGKHEDLLDNDVITFEEQLSAQFKIPDVAKFNGNGDPRVHLR